MATASLDLPGIWKLTFGFRAPRPASIAWPATPTDGARLKIHDPSGNLLDMKKSVSGGNSDFEAKVDGRFTYCFSNEHWSAAHKEVLFNVHGVVYVPEDPNNSDPLEKGVKTLGELLNAVKDEQEYIVVREMVHRNTAESTNSRVKWWSIFQLGVVGGNGVFQVWYLKRFFEVRFRCWRFRRGKDTDGGGYRSKELFERFIGCFVLEPISVVVGAMDVVVALNY